MFACAFMALFGASDTETQAQTRVENVSLAAIIMSVCGTAAGVATLLINRRYDAKYVKLEEDVKECSDDRIKIKVDHSDNMARVNTALKDCQDKHDKAQAQFEEERKRNEDRMTELVKSLLVTRASDNAAIQVQRVADQLSIQNQLDKKQ